MFEDNSLPDITWDEIIFCLNHNVMNDEYLNINVFRWFGIVLHKTEMHNSITDVLKEFSRLDDSKRAEAHIYISLTERSETFDWHVDDTEVIFWQAIGKTIFSVKEDNKIFEYELNKNSLVYLPRKIPHKTKPMTPRVGISLGYLD